MVLPFGKVVQFVNEAHGILLVMPHPQAMDGQTEQQIYDLDNLVCLPSEGMEGPLQKTIIGFISDVVGPIQMPLYSVALYEEATKLLKKHLDAESLDKKEQGSRIKEFFIGRDVSLA